MMTRFTFLQSELRTGFVRAQRHPETGLTQTLERVHQAQLEATNLPLLGEGIGHTLGHMLLRRCLLRQPHRPRRALTQPHPQTLAVIALTECLKHSAMRARRAQMTAKR